MTKHHQPDLNTSPPVADEIRKTTCYMCACRCGINVHMRDGKVKYIEGNRDHPVNRGVLCAKGSAGIMQHYSPARLRAPMKRVGERGSGEFEEISWDEALDLAASWLAPVRESAPEKLAFFTGRDQSQSFTGWWAQQFGTPNYAAHGGFCSVNMAAAGIYTLGGAFWEFGAPDWERTNMFMIFGVAEDHDSNPIKMGLGRLKERGAKVVGVNPVRTGYNAVADEWVSITPGTDGLFIMALIHDLLKAGKIDLDYLTQFTNAPVLLDADGLFARDEDGKELVWDRATNSLQPFDKPGLKPALHGTYEGLTPVFERLANRYLDDEYAPDNVAERTGVTAETIKRLAAELAHHAFDNPIVLNQPWTDFRGVKHETMIGRPVSFHAMRGISAHSNGFQTCRALHVLQLMLGSVETPGGFRFKPPYPKPVHGHPRPHAGVTPGKPLDGPHLGYPRGPEDLLMHADGTAKRIDKAYTWEAPMSAHGMMHMVISNAHAGDPYDIDVLFLYMANMAWNSSMNTSDVMRMLTDKDESGDYRIPKIIYSDAYSSEMVAYADLILPDTTYLERHDCISLLDRPICEPEAAADSIRWPVVEPDRDVQGFQTTLIKLGTKLGLPGMVTDDGEAIYADYADYITNHQRRPGIGPLAGFRGTDGTKAGRGEVNPNQIEQYKKNGGFWIRPHPRGSAVLQALQHGLPDLGERHGALRLGQAGALHLPALCRADAQVPDGRRGQGRPAAPRPPARPPETGDGPAARLVPALRGNPHRREGLPPSRHHPAPGGDVPFLGLAERLAPTDPRRQPALCLGRHLARAWLPGGRLGRRSPRITGPSPCPRSAWTRSTHIPSGPGTPSASARAPGRWTRTRRRRPRASCSTT